MATNHSIRVLPNNSALHASRWVVSIIVIVMLSLCLRPNGAQAQENPWPMAGHDVERTGRTPEQVTGRLDPLWYKIFDPYILPRTQIVAAESKLFITTARGLYALDATTGNQLWVHPTTLPLADTPAYANGQIFIGGFDRKLRAINAQTGQEIWSFLAQQGFQTSPIVANGIVYVGNRDGNFYALNITTGKQVWAYQTDGPITFGAAYKDNMVFFASNDTHAYALNATTGQLIWKSVKLPVSGFHSWYPVIVQNYVIFTATPTYRHEPSPFGGQLNQIEQTEIFPNYKTDPQGTYAAPFVSVPGPWPVNTPVLDVSRANTINAGGGPTTTLPITEYLEQKPWRRTVFMFDRQSGKEYTSDFDQDGKPEYPPFLWFGTHGGNRPPPVITSQNGVIFMQAYKSDPGIPDGGFVTWKIGTPYQAILNDNKLATDEPVFHTIGGNLLYESKCCDRYTFVYNLNQANASITRYYSYGSTDPSARILPNLFPNYKTKYITSSPPYENPANGFHKNGAYGFHGDVNAPIPYQGKVFMHRSNVVMAFGSPGSTPTQLPNALIPNTTPPPPSNPTKSTLTTRLETEVAKMLQAGHLRPGYLSSGITGQQALVSYCGDNLNDYFHQPTDTLITLLRTLPHLTPTLKAQVKTYLTNELTAYPPHKINHIGWASGAPREAHQTPPEFENATQSFPAQYSKNNFAGWTFDPRAFYALWLYAKEFGQASTLLTEAKNNKLLMSSLNTVPSDQYLADFPHVHNAYIAAYIGYLELVKLAKSTEDTTAKQTQLNRLLSLRATNLTNELPNLYLTNSSYKYCRALAARSYIYLIPELASYLHDHGLAKVAASIQEFDEILPYWFVSKSENEFGEGVIRNLYDSTAVMSARAWILKQDYQELAPYLDVPAFERGDLFYIQNLVTLLEAPSDTTAPTTDLDLDGDTDGKDYLSFLPFFDQSNCARNFLFSCVIDIFDFNKLLTAWLP